MCLRAGIIGIQFAHDIAHSVAASARNVTLGVPVYVPSLQVRSRHTSHGTPWMSFMTIGMQA